MNKRVKNQKQETTRRIPRKITKEEKAETSENTKNVKNTRNTRNTRKPREKREKKIQENTESKELVVRGENSIAERKTTRRENIFKKPKLKIIPLISSIELDEVNNPISRITRSRKKHHSI